jgi:hypothetical protein
MLDWLVPTFVVLVFNVRLIIGCQPHEGGYQFLALDYLNDPGEFIHSGLGVYLYFLRVDCPMFSIQLFPELDAHLLWLSPRAPKEDSEDESNEST